MKQQCLYDKAINYHFLSDMHLHKLFFEDYLYRENTHKQIERFSYKHMVYATNLLENLFYNSFLLYKFNTCIFVDKC